MREGKIFRGTYGLNRPMSFSYQYIGISAYANAHNANVELGFTKSDAAIRKTLECFGKMGIQACVLGAVFQTVDNHDSFVLMS